MLSFWFPGEGKGQKRYSKEKQPREKVEQLATEKINEGELCSNLGSLCLYYRLRAIQLGRRLKVPHNRWVGYFKEVSLGFNACRKLCLKQVSVLNSGKQHNTPF